MNTLWYPRVQTADAACVYRNSYCSSILPVLNIEYRNFVSWDIDVLLVYVSGGIPTLDLFQRCNEWILTWCHWRSWVTRNWILVQKENNKLGSFKGFYSVSLNKSNTIMTRLLNRNHIGEELNWTLNVYIYLHILIGEMNLWLNHASHVLFGRPHPFFSFHK